MQERVHTIWSNIWKGFVVGASMLVPGVSGGTMAILLHTYDKLIVAISSLSKNLRENLVLLLTFAFGGGVGLLLAAKPIELLLDRFPLPMMYFFIGAVAGGIPPMLSRAQVRTFSWRLILYPLLGAAVVLLLKLLPEGLFSGGATIGGLGQMSLLVLAGAISAIALVLPGISVSYFLLMLGLYDKVLAAISSLDIVFLMPLAVGVLLGILLTTKVIEAFMRKFPFATYLLILGFIIGSIIEVFPGLPAGILWLVCPLTFTAGLALISLLNRFGRKDETTRRSPLARRA